MQTRRISDVQVGAIGLGAMPMSVREDNVPEEQAIATIHAALDAGVTLVDTADAYAPDHESVGHNERLVAKALARYGGDTSAVLVATKGGHTRTPGGGWDVDASRDYIRGACEASLKALGVEAIGLHQYHRPDPSVPYAEAIGTFKELRDEGKVRLVGISNATVEQIAIAEEVLGEGGLASVQNQFSPTFRSSQGELDHCASRVIAFLPWIPLVCMGIASDLGSQHRSFAEGVESHG